jgi:hypothetical protein
MAEISDDEAACIKRLAELYEMAQIENGAAYQDDPKYKLRIPDGKWEPVLGAMENYHAIDDVEHADLQRFFSFRITQTAVLYARQIVAKEAEKPKPRNIVDEVKEKAFGHPVIAWIIVVGLVAGAILVPLAAIISILINMKTLIEGK